MIWYLEGFVDEEGTFRRVPILTSPFRIGRSVGSDLALDSRRVSRDHAELLLTGGDLKIQDRDSTNATFVNGQPLSGEAKLKPGDTLHFATLEFSLGQLERSQTRALLGTTTTIMSELPKALIARITGFRSVLDQRKIEMGFQPIVSLGERQILGYEVLLQRSCLEGFKVKSKDLFEIAAVLGAEAELSRLCRQLSLPVCNRLRTSQRIFLNTHPVEVAGEGFLGSLRELREAAPDAAMVIEIHEEAVRDLDAMKKVRAELIQLDFEIAYDDFGAGQDRLIELSEVPPDYLKFDIHWIRGIDKASPRRRRVLETLVNLALEFGIEPIAEGVETQAEDEACRELGISWGQGFLYGHALAGREV